MPSGMKGMNGPEDRCPIRIGTSGVGVSVFRRRRRFDLHQTVCMGSGDAGETVEAS
jgi:hypothetical protein